MNIVILSMVCYYLMQVFSLEDGPVLAVWKNIGVPVTLIKTHEEEDLFVDWLKYARHVKFLMFVVFGLFIVWIYLQSSLVYQSQVQIII